MPEGPEVLTIANFLNQKLKGEQLQKIILTPKSRFYDHPLIDCVCLPLLLVGVSYRHKKIIFEFRDEHKDRIWIISFLGMTGRWLLKKHSHSEMKWMFSNNINIFYDDKRKFGLLDICTEKSEVEKIFEDMGPDWITDDIKLNYFLENTNSKIEISKWLLDTKKTTGIGNYIKSETMYLANYELFKNNLETFDINCRVKDLSQEQKIALYNAIKRIFKESISAGGFTQADYLHPDGVKGGYKPYIYGLSKTKHGFVVNKLNTHGRVTYFTTDYSE